MMVRMQSTAVALALYAMGGSVVAAEKEMPAELPPLISAPEVHHTQEQIRAYSERNTPAQVESLARKLEAMLDTSRPGLAGFNARMRAGQYEAALTVFRDRLLDTIESLDFQFVLWKQTPPDALMKGIIHAEGPFQDGYKRRPIYIGQPGSVNWGFALEGIEPRKEPGRIARNELHALHHFTVLIAAATKQQDPRYMQQWCAYIDDYVMNSEQAVWGSKKKGLDLRTPPLFSCWRIKAILHSLGQIARQPDAFRQQLDPASVTRMSLYLVRDQLGLLMSAARNMSSNQSMSAGSQLVLGSVVFSDFRIAARMMAQGETAIDAYMNRYYLPDGTDVERSPNYNKAMLGGLSKVSRLGDIAPPWVRDLEGKMMLRARFLVAHTFPSRQDPNICISDLRDSLGKYEKLEEVYPQVYADPDARAIKQRIVKGDLTATPSFMSEWYPYGGFAYIRSGWDLQDQNLVMTCSRRGYGKMHEDANGIALFAFGQDLLVDPGSGKYTPDPQNGYLKSSWSHNTVQVDGYGQVQTTSPSKRAFRTPLKHRWLNSDSFNVLEGVYADNYGTPTHVGREKNANPILVPGVSHRRTIVFVRDLGLWVVLDRLNSDQPHRYTQTWNFPARVEKGLNTNPFAHWPPHFKRLGYFPGFSNEQVDVDAENQRIETRNPENANLTIYNFSARELEYTKMHGQLEPQVLGWHSPWIHDDKIPKPDVHVSWQGHAGTELLISLLHPRRSVSESLARVTRLQQGGAEGFVAETGDGTRLSCLASATPQKLVLGDLQVVAQCVVLAESSTGDMKGVLLDCSAVAWKGALLNIGDRDFEFVVQEGQFAKTGDIRLPVDQPLMATESGSAQFEEACRLTMAVSNGDADIHYTLDGREPTQKSPRYTQPLTLAASTTVKARSYRRDDAGAAASERFIDVSPVAVYTVRQVVPREAELPLPDAGAAPVGEGWQRGLNYQVHFATFMGDGVELGRFYEEFPVLKKGSGVAPFVESGKLRSVLFEGFFEAPRAGVYTFSYTGEAGVEIHFGSERVTFDNDGKWSTALKQGLHQVSLRMTSVYGRVRPEPVVTFVGPRIPDGVLDKDSFWCRTGE